MPTINAKDGSTISFSDTGSGVPILFLHGWMMSMKVWHYQQQLSSKLRVITMDLSGHGRSQADEFSYSSCLSDIKALMDYLNIERFFIAGWSMGSQLAIISAIELEERVAGLVLISGTPKFSNSDDYSCGLPEDEARGMKIRIKRDYKETSGQFFKNMFSEQEVAVADLKAIAANSVSILPPLNIALSALKVLTECNLVDLLPSITCPVLLIHGSDDTICPVKASEFVQSQLPDSTLVCFEHAGHAPFLTEPERFNFEVSRFIFRRVDDSD
ncbi:MAG: alpha/beta hydrolase [Geobacteraceae bacterium]|nr:alpha/beta hydrolase [Geobacteraceae bacterium]